MCIIVSSIGQGLLGAIAYDYGAPALAWGGIFAGEVGVVVWDEVVRAAGAVRRWWWRRRWRRWTDGGATPPRPGGEPGGGGVGGSVGGGSGWCGSVGWCGWGWALRRCSLGLRGGAAAGLKRLVGRNPRLRRPVARAGHRAMVGVVVRVGSVIEAGMAMEAWAMEAAEACWNWGEDGEIV